MTGRLSHKLLSELLGTVLRVAAPGPPFRRRRAGPAPP
jgi:hypothetical protein